jgi:hypothetical protein
MSRQTCPPVRQVCHNQRSMRAYFRGMLNQLEERHIAISMGGRGR